MVALVGKERGDSSGSTWSIVVSKLHKWEEISLVVLLIIAVNVEILFQSLVSSFSLTITFGMITRGEVKSDIKSLSKRVEEMGDKLWTPVRGDMGRYSMLGKDMGDKEFS